MSQTNSPQKIFVILSRRKNLLGAFESMMKTQFELLFGTDLSILTALQAAKKSGKTAIGGIVDLSEGDDAEKLSLHRSILSEMPKSQWFFVSDDCPEAWLWGLVGPTIEFRQLARGLGHELGNVFLKIGGYLELAEMGMTLADVQKDLQSMKSPLERGVLTVRNLQMVSKRDISLTNVDLRGVISSVRELMKDEFMSAGLSLREIYEGSQPFLVNADAKALTQVLQNLLLNAMQAQPHAREVVVRATDKGEISVEDTGTGVTSDVSARIFDFGFSTKGGGGAGIGLSVSKQLIEAMGGEISFNSTPKKGTIVRVTLQKVSKVE